MEDNNMNNIDNREKLCLEVFRHGDRTPTKLEMSMLPQYNDSYGPWDVGQLTKNGMIQTYELGKLLRKRYDEFLTKTYRAREVYARSSNVGRTINSLQSVLAALYTPQGDQKWNDNLNWLPIPIHTTPVRLDVLEESWACPIYIKQVLEVLNSEAIKSSKYYSVARSIFKTDEFPVLAIKHFALFNLLTIRKQFKLPLPEWCTDEFYKDIMEASDIHLDALSYTDDMKRIHGGPITRKIFENILKSNAKINPRKIYLYSGHEATVHAYLRLHNFTTFGNPDGASAVIVEKFYSRSKNQYFIKMLYWTGEPKRLLPLKLDNCSEMCPMERYSEMVTPLLPSDDEMRCLLENKRPEDLDKYLNEEYF